MTSHIRHISVVTPRILSIWRQNSNSKTSILPGLASLGSGQKPYNVVLAKLTRERESREIREREQIRERVAYSRERDASIKILLF